MCAEKLVEKNNTLKNETERIRKLQTYSLCFVFSYI